MDVDFYVKAIAGRVAELRASAWLPAFLTQLDSVLDGTPVHRIRCLALGSFTDFLNPRFQLALLLIMAEHLGSPTISAWDPVFTADDKAVLAHYKIEVTETDFGEPALWYVPHGPFSLVVDLPLKIGNDVYIGNDLSAFDLDNREKQDRVEAYKQHARILRVQTSRQDRWFAAFSSTAIHRTET